MKNIKDLFEVLKARKFLEGFTDININGGVRHRLAGRGTNEKDKVNELRDDERAEIKKGWKKFVEFGNKIIDKL